MYLQIHMWADKHGDQTKHTGALRTNIVVDNASNVYIKVMITFTNGIDDHYIV